MRTAVKFSVLTALLLFALSPEIYAQKYPERRIVRQGNRDYAKGLYGDSEIDYRRALEENHDFVEAQNNLGNSLFRQERYEEAEKVYERLSRREDLSETQRAEIHYNLGNTLVVQEKLQEALEEYKKSLRHNPSDMAVKYNLAYVKKLLEQQQDDDQDNEDNKDDQDKQDNQDNQDRDNDDNQDDDPNGDDDRQENDQDDNENKPQENDRDRQEDQPSGLSEQQIEQMLQAIQDSEDRTREKLEENAQPVAAPSGKNW